MEALQKIDEWRQAARANTIKYCESDDRLKANGKEMAAFRKSKQEAREAIFELLETKNAPGFNVKERGYYLSFVKRKAKKAASKNLMRSRCIEWRGGSGEELYDYLTAPVVVETQSLQRSAQPKAPKGKQGKVEESDEEDEEELEGDE